MNDRCKIRRALFACATLAATCTVTATAQERQPFADAHIHFNWDQQELVSAEAIVEKLERAGVAFAVVSATPSALALELKAAGGDLIVQFFSPYTHEMGRLDWHLDRRTVELAEQGLRDGLYRGIGEVHFMRGFRPRIDNRIFNELLELARRYRVPVLIHVDAGSEKTFVDICRANPDVELIFAHAGGQLMAPHIRRVIQTCANATIEFSARDPWRFGGLTGADGRLLPEWRELVIAYPDRFVTGTDPVWKVTRTQTWDQPDDGWDYFERLIAYHRTWIADLPVPVQRRISLDNARELFGRAHAGE